MATKLAAKLEQGDVVLTEDGAFVVNSAEPIEPPTIIKVEAVSEKGKRTTLHFTAEYEVELRAGPS